MDELVALTRELVAIPSHDDETTVGDRIVEWLAEETDARIERDGAPGGGNIIARRGIGSTSLALVGHHDVVEPAPQQVASDGTYRVEQRDGRLYGRGTADMTGALAAAMLAFRDASPTHELVFASFVGEEQGGIGAAHAIENGFCPDYAIVGEGSAGYTTPGVIDVVIAHKGRRATTITATGTQTHASVPETGENAIYRACEAIDRIQELKPPQTTVNGQSLTGSVVATEIEGGTAWNVVPDHCTVTVDERTVPGDRVAFEEVTDMPGVTWTVDQDLPPMECADPVFTDLVRTAADHSQPGTPTLTTKPHATDAGRLAAAGTGCVVCGPAESGEAHTDTESVSITALRRCAEIYQRAAEQSLPTGD